MTGTSATVEKNNKSCSRQTLRQKWQQSLGHCLLGAQQRQRRQTWRKDLVVVLIKQVSQRFLHVEQPGLRQRNKVSTIDRAENNLQVLLKHDRERAQRHATGILWRVMEACETTRASYLGGIGGGDADIDAAAVKPSVRTAG